jgi:serine/threonine-protein kinase
MDDEQQRLQAGDASRPNPARSPGASASPNRTRIPEVIGGFRITAKLGQGGMGAVFKAIQISMDRPVALKLLPPGLARNENFIERFRREARVSVQIAHPNLVQGIDVGQDQASGLWYFAMEFVSGEPLRAVLRRDGRLDERRALTIARDLAAGLAAAHRAGVIHRDVKPDNVMITPEGTAKILDLGLAKSEQDDSSLTQTGASLGTPLYMAPEQARGELQSIDAATDLYALGATLFHLIAGRPPFEGPTSAVILAQHLTKPAPKLE